MSDNSFFIQTCLFERDLNNIIMGPKTLWIVSPFTFIYEFFQSNEIYPENIGYIIYFDCGIPKMVGSKKQGFWTNILWKQWNAAHHKSQNLTFKVDFILEHFIFKIVAQILMIWHSLIHKINGLLWSCRFFVQKSCFLRPTIFEIPQLNWY